MSNRASRIVLLCEDEKHAQLLAAYVRRCGYTSHERTLRARVASRERHGGNIGWVLEEFPKELKACRQRQKRAQTLLIVLVDADSGSIDARRLQLFERVKQSGYPPLNESDPMVLLVAKYHIETWICSLLGQTVSEDEDCKSKMKFRREDIRVAARNLYDWSRENASPPLACVSSLKSSLSEWRKISDLIR